MRRVITAAALLYAFATAAWEAARERWSEGKPGGKPASTQFSRLLWRWLLVVAAVGLLFAIGGFLVALSGLIPMKASAGHWSITRWFLEFSMRRSVETHSLGIVTPSLDEPSMIMKGAAHYEFGCRPCHGSPDLRRPRVAAAMLPSPPYLPEQTPIWTSAELFYIVKHGFKFTGMPGWPTQQRDDEVWAMVAFLRRFEDMSPDEYRRLARGETAAEVGAPLEEMISPRPPPRQVIESCSRCHGRDGLGRGTGAFPKLAGQKEAYLSATLQAFARGERHSGIMQPLAAGLSEEAMRDVARYYSSLPAPQHVLAKATGEMGLGRSIATRGIPSQRVPACIQCHGPADQPRNARYPILSGQYSEYLQLQLRLLKERKRGGTEYGHLMHHVADHLTPQQMQDVADFYSTMETPD